MNRSGLLLLVAASSVAFVGGHATASEKPQWKTVTYMSAWGPCPRDERCGSVWLLDRATRSIERKGLKATPLHKLASEDWGQLEELLSLATHKASACPPPPTDVFETLQIVNSDGTQLSYEITGCVFDDSSNPAKTLASWLQEH